MMTNKIKISIVDSNIDTQKSLLKSIKKHEEIEVIIISVTVNNNCINHCISLVNVKYIHDKNFNIDNLIKKTLFLYKMKQIENAINIKYNIVYDKIYYVITEVLISSGLKSHLSGFN